MNKMYPNEVRLSSGFGAPTLSENVEVRRIPSTPEALAEQLELEFQDGTEYPWISPLVWKDNHPSSTNAESAGFLAFDVDDEEVKLPRPKTGFAVEHPAMAEERRSQLIQTFEDGHFSFHMMYLTRHGARFLMVFDREMSPQEYQILAPAFAQLLQDELIALLPHLTTLKVDNTHDLARRFFAPSGVFGKRGFSYNGKKRYHLNAKVYLHPNPSNVLSEVKYCLQYAKKFGPKTIRPVLLQREKEEVELHLPEFPVGVFPARLEQTFRDFGATIHGEGQGRDFASLIGLSVIFRSYWKPAFWSCWFLEGSMLQLVLYGGTYGVREIHDFQ